MPSEHSNRGKKRARDARAELGIDPGGPLPDLIDVVERLGQTHVLILDLPDGVAGAYLFRTGCPLLLVNGRQAVTRQRFTLAHEFGHHRMGHSTVVDEQEAISGHLRIPTEVCANAFAAEFLMPQTKVAARANGRTANLEDVVVLAHEYGVSAQAARYAMQTAGVLSDSARCDQLDAEIAEEVHVELAGRLGLQPLEDELADVSGRLPRIPPAMRGSALGSLLAGELDVATAAARSGREVEEFTAMLDELGISRLLPDAA